MLTKLILQNFRSYSKKTFDFPSRTTLIVGPNASGKTNILEAIYLLAAGKSFRAELEREVIRDGQTVARVAGSLVDKTELEVILDNRQHFHKLYKVNGVGKRQIDFVGNLRAVLFQPIDLEIVIGSPATRRHYLDNVLSQAHRDYRQAVSLYEKGLKQRNRLLWRAKKEGRIVSQPQLEYWDRLLIDNGKVIHAYRQQFLDFVNNLEEAFFSLDLTYDHSIISEARLERYRLEEQSTGTTLVGPHRDDFTVKFKSKTKFRFTRTLSSFGSRGEQRLGVFTLKLAEVDYIFSQSGTRPILLLDDIFSELDESNRHHVLDFVARQQTIITATDVHKPEESFLARLSGQELRLKEDRSPGPGD